MAYVDTPIPTDKQSVSAPQMRGNFSQANTSFGTDHYAFSDLTANNGFHKYIHTVQQSAHPTTTAAIPQIYAMQDTSAIGVLDYSRGWNIATTIPAVPTPLTKLQSPTAVIVLAPSTTTDIVDFTGCSLVIGTLRAVNNQPGRVAYLDFEFFYSSTTSPKIVPISNTTFVLNYAIGGAGSTLQVQNTSGALAMNNVSWVLELHRIQT